MTEEYHLAEPDGKLSLKLIDLFEAGARPMTAPLDAHCDGVMPVLGKSHGSLGCSAQAWLGFPSIFHAIVFANCELFVRIVLAPELIS